MWAFNWEIFWSVFAALVAGGILKAIAMVVLDVAG